MINDILKSYNGTCIIDENSSYSFDDLINQIEKFRVELKAEIIKNENIVIYSDYNFHSISLLLLLSEYPINIVPIVKTT